MNIYFNEYNLLMGSGGVTYLPLVSGILQASAQSDNVIASNYDFMPFLFSLDEPTRLLGAYTATPDVACFSIAMWNENLSLEVARQVKEKYPHCLIVFGGAQCPHNPTDYFSQYSFIDITVRAEGEVAFMAVLKRLLENRTDFSGIPNVAFRSPDNGKCVVNPEDNPLEKNLDQYVSPYLAGVYEYLFNQNECQYQMIIETNRGCPFLCTFCYWGRGGYTRKFRFHSLARISAEIEWAAKHKISYMFNADSNFGMHRRDLEIANMLVQAKQEYGYPEKFRTCWGKNTDEKIYRIARLLHEHGLDKGMTLGRQSNSKKVLSNIKRDNISLEAFSSMQEKFNANNVPIYAELILGLPGETRASWINGIEELLLTGLNNQLFVYPSEVYPNTEQGDPIYRKKFGIRTTKIELLEIHCTPRPNGWVKEYQEIVTSTNSMTEEDWRYMIVFSWVVMLLHSLNLGVFVMWYLNNRYHIRYAEFIDYFITTGLAHSQGVIGGEVRSLFQSADAMLKGCGRGHLAPEYGEILWDIEEISFLKVPEQLNDFVGELTRMVIALLQDRKINYDRGQLNEVMEYQLFRLPRLSGGSCEQSFKWNLGAYFSSMFDKSVVDLEQSGDRLVINRRDFSGIKKDFAQQVLLWGRKSGTLLESIDYTQSTVQATRVFQGEGGQAPVAKFSSLEKFEPYTAFDRTLNK